MNWSEMKDQNITLKEKKLVVEFQKILSVLNKYSDYTGVKETDSSLFRKEIVKTDPKKLKIVLTPMSSNYRFIVTASINKGGKEKTVTMSWIHFDGIQEEKDLLFKKILNECNSSMFVDPSHPIFKIVCLTDIYLTEKNLQEQKKLQRKLRKRNERKNS